MADTLAQPATTNPLGPLNACVSIPDPLKRLTCFDAAMVEARRIAERRQGLTPGATLDNTATADAQFGLRQQKETRGRTSTNLDTNGTENDFGKSAVQINQERRNQGLEEKEQPSLSATIIKYSYDIYGKMVIELSNGQIWQTTGSSDIKKIPDHDSISARITKSFFGGYRLKIDGAIGSDVVKRIQ